MNERVEAILSVVGTDSFASEFQRASDSVRGFQEETGRISKTSGGFLSGIRSMISGIGKFAGAIGITKLVSAGFDLIRNSVDGAVSRVDTLNQYPRVLQQMGYSAEEAQASTTRLTEGIQGLPTPLDEVVGTTQRFVTAFGDVDLATETTLALNNALLASGADANSAANATDQYVKTLSSGKLEMDTWNTLSETMSYALSEVAKDLGIADGDIWALYDSIKAGEITLDEFNQAMIDASNETGGFAETALTASEGIRTSMTNIKTAITTGVGNAIQAVNDAMEAQGFGSISENLDRVKDTVYEAFSAIISYIPPVVAAIGSFLQTIRDSTAFQTFTEAIGLVIDKVQELWRTFLESTAFAVVSQAFRDLGQAVLEIDFVTLIQDIAGLIERWAPLIAGIMGAIGAFKIISAIIPIVTGAFKAFSILKTLVSSVGLVQTAFTLLAPVIGGISAPVLIAVAVIGGLIAVGVALWQNWDTVRAKAIEIWGAIRDWFTQIWESISSGVQSAWTGIQSWLVGVWSNITSVATTIFSGIQTVITTVWNVVQTITSAVWNVIQTILLTIIGAIALYVQAQFNLVRTVITTVWNVVSSVTSTVWNVVKSVIQSAVNAVKNVVTTVFNTVASVVTNIWNRIRSVTTTVWNAVRSGITTVVNAIRSVVSSVFNAVLSVVTNVWNRVRSTTVSVWNTIRSAVQTAVNAVRSVVSSVFNAVRNIITNVWNSIRSTTSSVWNSIRSVISSIVNNIRSTISNIFNSLRGIVSNAFNAVRSAVSNGMQRAYQAVVGKVQQFYNAGRNIVTSIADGIRNAVGAVTDAIGGVVDKIRSFLPFSPAKEGPLKDIDKLNFGGTIAESIYNGRRTIEKAMSSVMELPEPQEMTTGIHDANRRLEQEIGYSVRVADRNRKPAYINLSIGGRSYRAYVEDISDAQGEDIDLKEAF